MLKDEHYDPSTVEDKQKDHREPSELIKVVDIKKPEKGEDTCICCYVVFLFVIWNITF